MRAIGTHTDIPLSLAGKRHGEPLSHLHDQNYDIPTSWAGASLLMDGIDTCRAPQPHAPVE